MVKKPDPLSKSSHNLTRLPVAAITRDVAAKLDGVPPIVLLASQMSTTRWGNTISYRSSGPIPEGLYRNIMNGTAAPKPFTQKVKSSNWGVMEGFAVVNDRLARSEVTGKRFSIRAHSLTDLPMKEGVVTLNKFPLKMALRDILAETIKKPPKLESKYELLTGNNPDENGNLRFQQSSHPNPMVNSVIFSINLNDLKAEKTPNQNYELMSSQLDQAAKKVFEQPDYQLPGWRPELGSFADKLDMSYSCFAQFPGENEVIPVEVYGEKYCTVRDTDIDFFTRPTSMEANLAKSKDSNDKFYQLLDMSHGSPEDKFDASKKMISLMFEINQSEWKQYEILKKEKILIRGSSFNEIEIADKMPLVPKFRNLNLISKFAVTVGLGSPIELYQAMEINIINQKVLSLKQKRPEISMDDFTNPVTKKAALFELHKEPLVVDENTKDRFFIQHPAECHNHHYTSERGASVIIHKNSIALAKNDTEVIKYLNSNAPNEHVPLNPEWMGEKHGANANAADWVKFYISNFDSKKTVPETHKAVVGFLENNPAFIEKELKNFTGDQKKLTNFLKTTPAVNEMVAKAREKVEEVLEHKSTRMRL